MTNRVKKYTPESFKMALEQQQYYNKILGVNSQVEEVFLEQSDESLNRRKIRKTCEQNKLDNKAKKENIEQILVLFQTELENINEELDSLQGQLLENYVDNNSEFLLKIQNLSESKSVCESYIYYFKQQQKILEYDYLYEKVDSVNFMNDYMENGYNLFDIDYKEAQEGVLCLNLELMDTKDNPLNRLAVLEYLVETRPEGWSVDYALEYYLPGIGGIPHVDYVDLYRYLTEDEKAKYHYLFEHEGNEAAFDYVYNMMGFINERKGRAEADEFLNSLDYTDEDKLKQSISNYFDVSWEGLGDGVDSFWEGLFNVIASDGVISADDYKKMYVLQGLQEKSNSLDEVYKFNMSLGNLAPVMIFSSIISFLTKNPTLGAKIASMLMGLSSGGNAKEQALQSGNSETFSTLYGIFTGFSEATLGYYLGKIPGISKMSGFKFGDLLQEGAEEFLQTYIEAGLQAVILGEDVDWSEIPAHACESFIMGVLMSGFLNKGQATVNMIIDKVTVPIYIEDTLQYLVDNPDKSVIDAFCDVNNIDKAFFSSIRKGVYDIMFQSALKVSENLSGMINKFNFSVNLNNKQGSSSESLAFFENSGFQYGVDQHAINRLAIYIYNGKKYDYHKAIEMVNDAYNAGLPIPKFTKIHSPEYNYQKNKLISMGFSSKDAAIILECIDDAGACTYADTCNQIFYQYRNNPEKFEADFGYPMYKQINGVMSLNSTDLLLDLYLFVNKVTNGGAFILNGNRLNPHMMSNAIDIFGRNLLNTDQQVDLSEEGRVRTDVINRFLKSKNPKLNYEAVLVKANFSTKSLSTQEMDSIISYVLSEMNNGKSISMDVCYDKSSNNEVIHFNSLDESKYRSVSSEDWGEGGAHGITITGVENNGFVVSSWGNKYIIPYDDLINGGIFQIFSTNISYVS